MKTTTFLLCFACSIFGLNANNLLDPKVSLVKRSTTCASKPDIKGIKDLLIELQKDVKELKNNFNHEMTAIWKFVNGKKCSTSILDKNQVCSDPRDLGMRNGFIEDSQITASSEFNSDHSSSNARLFYQNHGGRTGAWSSKQNNRNQWIQVDFRQTTVVVGISTQGRAEVSQWVKSYSLSYSEDGVTFNAYKPNGIAKVFLANKDRNTVVHNSFPTPIFARIVRIHPKSWNGHISMRMEFHGCYIECKAPAKLGLENGQIRDRQMSASSEFDSNHGVTNGRLNFKAHGGKTGAWSAKVNDINQWMQVDLEQQTVVTGISTQGRDSCSCNQFVKTYLILYSNDGKTFYPYKETNKAKVFTGNNDMFLTSHNAINPPIFARYIRVQPQTWHNHISMRMELFGCYKDCDDTKDLGMRSKKIGDPQISASSEWDPNHGPSNARLFSIAKNGKKGAWSAKTNDLNQWLQVDFKKQTVVSGISTQGRADHTQYVKTYTLYHSYNGKTFIPYKHNGQVKVFSGNLDRHSVVHHVISPAIVARYIRIEPKSWYQHISLRVEFYGC